MAKKKKKKDDAVMFPEYEPKDERFQARPEKVRIWTEAEEHVMVAVISSCGFHYAHVRTCLTLQPVYDRKPAYGELAKPDRKLIVKDAIDLFQCHRWKMVAGHRGFVPKPMPGLVRDGLPMTWGEFVLFVKVYHDKRKKNITRINVDQLTAMLGRSSPEPILKALERLDNDPTKPYPENYGLDPAMREIGLVKRVEKCLKKATPGNLRDLSEFCLKPKG